MANMDNFLLTNNLIEGLGWTILHSLWQAVLLAGVLWLASHAITSARKRYWLAYGTLLAQLLVSIATFCWLYEPVAAAAVTAPNAEVLYAFFLSAEGGETGWNPNALLFWVVIFWCIGLLVGTVRLGISFGRVRRMQRAAQAAVPDAFRQRVTDLAHRLGFHGQLNIGVGALIDGPALVGHFKPLLLFPLAVVNQLSVEEAEAVILHELAHLQRKDHWWNLLQCIIEVIFYYHPVVWWIGARIREEREHCCDDVVLRHGPGRIAYAKALLYFEEHRATPATAVALTNNPTGLLGRVQRFLNQQNLPYQMKSRLFLLPLLALIAVVATAAYHPAEETTEASATTNSIEAPLNSFLSTPVMAPAAAPELLVAPPQMEPDTLPQGRHQVSSFRNGKSTEVTVEDGEIKSLKIDGETIPPAEYDEHEPMVERLLGGSSLRERGRLNHGDFEDSFRGMEFHFDNNGERLERHFEGMGESWENFGERMGELGERFGQMFQFDSDGGVFKFEFGRDTHIDLDSLMSTLPEEMRSFRISPDGQSRQFFFDSDGDQEKELDYLLRQKERSLQEEEAELERMETMIEKLERRKAEQKMRLEELRRKEGGEDGVREQAKERRNEQNERRAEIRRSQAERTKAIEQSRTEMRQQRKEREAVIAESRAAQAQRSEELNREREAQLAEIRRDNQERLAEIEREKAAADPNYESIIEQLQREKLLPEGELRKLVVDNKSLKFNGSKASPKAHERFLQIYTDRHGLEKLGSSFKVKVSKY